VGRKFGWTALSLVWMAMACMGDSPDAPAHPADRDLTTVQSELEEEPAVVSAVELAQPTRSLEAPVTVAEVPVADPEPVLVKFTDGLDLAAEPKIIEAALPILGAGAGTMLQSGATVSAKGPPLDLFASTTTSESPWPEARPGEYPAVNRDGIGLAVGGGSGGHCPMPGVVSR